MGKDQEFLEAARIGNITLFEKLLNQKNKRGGPLASLRRGPGINVQDSVGYSALHYSSLNGHSDIVRLLLYHDASPNLLDSRGSSALHLAAWAGHQEIVKMLLTHPYKPANPDIRTMENETPLHCAAQHGHTGALTTLLAHGANPNVRNNRNETPLDLAAQYGRLQAVQMLIRAHPELLQPYTNVKSDVSRLSPTEPVLLSHSALHLASRNGHNMVVEILLAAGVNVNLLTSSGTALHEAALCGKDVVVRTLLEAGADLNATDSENRTTLDILQEFPPHVTKSIISVINSFRKEDSNNMQDQISWKEANIPFSRINAGMQQSSSSNGDISDYTEPIKNAKTAPKKPPRRNLSISPTHLQYFLFNKEFMRYNVELSNNVADNEALHSADLPLQNDFFCGVNSGSADYNSDESNFDAKNCTSESSYFCSWYSGSTEFQEPECEDETAPACRKHKSEPPEFENVALKSYNPHRKLKRSREHQYTKGQFNLTISNICEHQATNCSLTKNAALVKHELSTTSKPIRKELDHNEHQKFYIESEISPNENHTLSQCNSSGSVSSGVSIFNRSLSTDCVEEYVGDAPLAGLSNVKSQLNLNDIPRHAESSTTDSELSDSKSDVATYSVIIDKVEKDKHFGHNRRNKNKQPHNIRKIRPYSTCESTQELTSYATAIRCIEKSYSRMQHANSLPPLQPTALDKACGSASINKKVPYPYNEQEAWDKLSQIVESFGNSTLNFICDDDIYCSGKYDTLAKLLDHNGLKHLESSLYSNGYDNLRFLNGILNENDLSSMNIFGEDAHTLLLLIKTLPYDDFMPLSVDVSLDQWLKSIQLSEYSENFKKHLYNTLKSVCGVWEIELQTVLEINKIGHRRRILCSVAHISNDDAKNSNENIADKNTTESTKGNISEGTSRRNKKNGIAPDSPNKILEIRAPCELLIGVPHNLKIKWPHSISSLVSSCLKYEVCYLGSTVVKELRGTETTYKSIQKLKHTVEKTCLNESFEKLSVVQLAISHSGVEFIDIERNKTICEHEIRNINCACQDADDMRHFAYITKDDELNLYYCHVFLVNNMHLAMEIMLTLAESFEIAYQMALRKTFVHKSRETQLGTN